MQARYKTLEKERLESFVIEIETLITKADMGFAIKRLGYFVEEFAVKKNQAKRKVNLFCSRYEKFLTEERLGIFSAEENTRVWRELSYDVLKLICSVIEEYTISYKVKYEDNKGLLITKPINKIVFFAKHITKHYSRKQSNEFNLFLPELKLRFGEITSIFGENGNGKTTLLKIIAGELAQSSGKIEYPALIDSKKRDWYKIKQQIAYIPQDLPKWSGLLVDNLHFAAAIHGIKGK